MEKALQAALKAAKAYKVRNYGDGNQVDLVINMLTDCLMHCEALDELADAHDRAQRIATAQNELRQAQSE